MWFKSKAEQVQPQLEPQDVWIALESQRSLELQRRNILELESRLHRVETWTRTGILLVSGICIAAAIATAWNTYQVYQWRYQVEEVAPQ